MITVPARTGRKPTQLLGTLAFTVMTALSAHAQSSLTSHYIISMTRVPIGEISWHAEIGGNLYATTATGKASGVLSVLVNGEGSVETHGTVNDGRMTPSHFVSHIVDDDGDTELRVTFENSIAKQTTVRGPPPKPDRLPVTDADLRGVSDPLTAMLLSTKSADAIFNASNCDRVLLIYDGRRRYNLALSYLRTDSFKTAHGYSGPVLVCGVVLQPIGGYKRDSLLVKYVAGRRDMELWFAPIAGTATMVPIQVSMPTLIGTLKIVADEFNAIAAKPSVPAAIETLPLAPPR
jgi:Protein of unknown function (DUF3108)